MVLALGVGFGGCGLLVGFGFWCCDVVELLLSGGFWVFVFPMVLRDRFGLRLRCLAKDLVVFGWWGVWLVSFDWCFRLISVVFASGYWLTA